MKSEPGAVATGSTKPHKDEWLILWVSTFLFSLAIIMLAAHVRGFLLDTRAVRETTRPRTKRMEKLFRSGRALMPGLSLAAPLLLFGILMVLRAVSPTLFCMEVNPGGKETICGSDYSHIYIKRLQVFGLCAWVLLVITGGTEVFRGKATRPAIIAWSVSALMFVSWVMLWLTRPVECTP